MKLYKPKYRDRTTNEVCISPKWSVMFFIKGRRYSKTTGMTDKRAADSEARRIVRDTELEVAGEKTYREAREALINGLVEEYVAELRRRGRVTAHIATTSKRIHVMLEGASTLSDVTSTFVRNALERLAETPWKRPQSADGARGSRRSTKTQNGYRTALHGLFHWLVRMERWPSNPVEAVSRARETDPEHPRRALTPGELDRLLAATEAKDTRMGYIRRVVYLVAASTGLRRSELRLLVRSDVNLDAATVTLRPSTTKNKRPVTLPLNETAVQALIKFMEQRPPRTGHPELFPSVPTLATFRDDLDRAHVEWRAAVVGSKLDFHALRVTFITDLARADVPLVMAQRLARHSDPKLTANVYSKLELHDARDAVARLDTLRKQKTGKAGGKAEKKTARKRPAQAG